MQRSREADEKDLRPLEGIKQFWQVMGADSRSQAGFGVISGLANEMASNALRDWMGQSGNTRLQFNSYGEASADLLLPLWDAPSTLVYNQQGIRVNKERTTVNVGLGLRHYVSDHIMLGVNSFYDRDITGNNARFSLGAEAWTHFLKLSANKYQRLTDWHQSPLEAMEDYDERPANGYDLAADAWLPFYPQFGASVKYEKYFGKGIILDNSASPSGLQDSPSAVTTTLNYTPIPLLTFKAGHKSGSGSDSFVGLDINYRLGLSWNEQTDRETVRVMRSLPGARYDFVDRNYNIVMQYRKQNLISLSLPSSVTAEAASTTVITANVRAKYGLKKIDWRAAELLAAGGTVIQDSATSVAVRLPKYHHEGGVNSYTLSAIATDNNGNESPESTVVIHLVPSTTLVTLEVKPADNVVANGVDTVQLQAKVTGKSGDLLSDHRVRFVVSGINDRCILKGANSCEALQITDTSGMTTVPLASTRAGKVTLFSHLDNGNSDSKTLNFIADSSTAELAELTVVVNNAAANGKAANKANVIVADYYGNPISNAAVTFAVKGAAALSTTTTVTDSNGSATVDLTSKLAGNVTLTASANGMSKQATLTFVGDIRTAKVDVLMATPATDLNANGTDLSVLTALVKDANGNLVSGASVSFSATGGAKLSQSAVITDQEGLARVNLTSTRSGSSTVSANTADDKIGKQATVTFVGDISTAQVGSFTASPTSGVKANGIDISELKAVVQDARGNTVSGVMVNFAVTGEATLSQASARSGDDGTATVTLSSSSASSSTVTATTSFDSTGKQASVSFAADVATALIDSLVASPAVEVKANGIATSTLSATVKDAKGNLVSGAQVYFINTGSGKLIQQYATSKNGIAIVQLTNTVAEIVAVSAITDSDYYGKDATVSFIADATTAKIFSLTASRASEVKANGNDNSVLTALVKDNQGNAVGGVSVTFRVNGQASLSALTAKTASDGTATVTLSSQSVGSSTVTVVADFDTAGKQVSVNFIADIATAKIDSLTASPLTEVNANGSEMSVLTVTVKDANGHLVNNANVVFSVLTGQGKLNLSSARTRDGIAKVQLTSTAAAISTVKAVTDFDTNGKQVSVSFMADVTTAKIDSLTASRIANVIANGTDNSVLTATVRDAHGNLVSGAKVFFNVQGKGKLSQTSATTVDGLASTTLTSLSAENLTVTAISNLDSTGKQASVRFIAHQATAKIDSITASRTSKVKANGIDYSLVTVTMKDSNGNLVTGAKVSFSVKGNAQLSNLSAISAPNGIAEVELRSLVATSSMITAITEADNTGKSASVSFIADIDTAKVDSLTAFPATAQANGHSVINVQAVVKDAQGNLVNDAQVTVYASGGADVTPNLATTNSEGIINVALTHVTAGSITVTAKTDSESTGKKATVTFVADSETASIASLASTGLGVWANGREAITVSALVEDANGNPVVNEEVTFHVSGSAILSQSSARTNALGRVMINATSTKADSSTVTAVTAYDTTGKQVTISFVADYSTAKLVSITASRLDNVKADGIDSSIISATMTDAHGNFVSGYPLNFNVYRGAKLDQNVARTVNGVATVRVTSTWAVMGQITASAGGNTGALSIFVSFVGNLDTARIDSLTASGTSAVKANGSNYSELTARVIDANGNGVSGEKVLFKVITGAGKLSQTSAISVSGIASVQLTSLVAETSTVTASSDLDKTGKQASVRFIADKATAKIDSLTASPTSEIIANNVDKSAISVRVKDANGNPVHGEKVSFRVEGGYLSSAAISDVDGLVVVNLTSYKAGINKVIASTNLDKVGKQVSVSFIGNPVTAKIVNLTASRQSEVKANGTDSSVLKATVTDTYGNPVKQVKVFFSVNGKANLSAPSAITDSDGFASVNLTSLTAGSSTVTAVTDNDKKGQQTSVRFMADETTAEKEVKTKITPVFTPESVTTN
ncbi:Ig-like domain-containing protein [Erwinia sp.]|uniref:Ig-like domain-containing protein n=1 Tax=Erwinia citreus TaxID=558 RepID=UPI003C754072